MKDSQKIPGDSLRRAAYFAGQGQHKAVLLRLTKIELGRTR